MTTTDPEQPPPRKPKPLTFNDAKALQERATDYSPALGMSRVEHASECVEPHEYADSMEAARKVARPLTPEESKKFMRLLRKHARGEETP